MSSLVRAARAARAVVKQQHHASAASTRLLSVAGVGGARNVARISRSGMTVPQQRVWRGNGLLREGGGRYMARQEQPVIWRPSRGVFSSGSGGPSNEVLRMLEQEAAHSPGDANAEV